MVLVQKWPFSQLFSLGNVGLENVFYDILEQKKAFLGYKKKKFKRSKNWHFPKGLTRGFASKMVIFPTSFFFGKIGQENVFYDILELKNASLGKKTTSLLRWKIHIFSKGLIHAFAGSKNGRFSNLFFNAN